MLWLYRVISILSGWAAAKILYNTRWDDRRRKLRIPRTEEELERAVETFIYPMWYETLWFTLYGIVLFVAALAFVGYVFLYATDHFPGPAASVMVILSMIVAGLGAAFINRLVNNWMRARVRQAVLEWARTNERR